MRCDPGPPERPLRIALSARIMHESPAQLMLRGKTLHYVEEAFSQLLGARAALPCMIPPSGEPGCPWAREYAAVFDGLVLQGGSDLDPATYGQTPISADWPGDARRDRYELALLEAFLRAGKPVLGVCRGAQLVNAAFGGTLYQDIPTQLPAAGVHRVGELYELHQHDVLLIEGSGLAGLYAPLMRARVTSIHHQAVDRLGAGLRVEAVAAGDGIVEAFRAVSGSYVVGVQWHPEFQLREPLLPPGPLIDEFLAACAAATPARPRSARA